METTAAGREAGSRALEARRRVEAVVEAVVEVVVAVVEDVAVVGVAGGQEEQQEKAVARRHRHATQIVSREILL